MSWDLENTKAGNGGNNKTNFTKFQEGVTEIRALDTVPHMRWNHWMPQYKRAITCPGMECPICKLNKQAKANGQKNKYDNSRSWSMNIYNHNTNQLELNEQGVKFMEELRECMEQMKAKGMELSDAIVKVRMRKGSDNKAVWRMDLAEPTPMSEAEKQAMENLTDRMEYFKAPTVEQVQALLEAPVPSLEVFLDVMGYKKKDDEEFGEEVNFETE